MTGPSKLTPAEGACKTFTALPSCTFPLPLPEEGENGGNARFSTYWKRLCRGGFEIVHSLGVKSCHVIQVVRCRVQFVVKPLCTSLDLYTSGTVDYRPSFQSTRLALFGQTTAGVRTTQLEIFSCPSKRSPMITFCITNVHYIPISIVGVEKRAAYKKWSLVRRLKRQHPLLELP